MVYFILRPVSGQIKIGYSATPIKRWYELQLADKEKLHLLVVIKGSLTEESELHHQFASFKINEEKEWFNASDELLSFIADRGDQQSLEKLKKKESRAAQQLRKLQEKRFNKDKWAYRFYAYDEWYKKNFFDAIVNGEYPVAGHSEWEIPDDWVRDHYIRVTFSLSFDEFKQQLGGRKYLGTRRIFQLTCLDCFSHAQNLLSTDRSLRHPKTLPMFWDCGHKFIIVAKENRAARVAAILDYIVGPCSHIESKA
jgi:hypothetical protein